MIRAKFTCNKVEKWPENPQEGQQIITSFEFWPVYGNSEENKKFWAATPNGKINLFTTSLPETAFEVGKEYYVDFTSAH